MGQQCNYSSINKMFEAQTQSHLDNIAITAPGRTPLTYRRLREHIQDVTAKLNAIGISRNDRVAVCLPNGPEMAVAFLAIACSATCAPLNPAYRAQEFDFYLKDLNAKALIIQPGFAEPAREVAQAQGIAIIELFPLLEAEAGLFILTDGELKSSARGSFAQPENVALILHTSGTTSRPKIVPLTHANLCTSAKNIRFALKLVESDRCLNVMPLFHIHGLIGVLLSSLSAGGSVVCTPGFYAPKFFEWVEEFCPTWYSAVPTMHQGILAQAKANHDISRCPIRLIRSSSAPLPPQVMSELEKVFHAPVIESYGMTEASHQVASNPLPPLVRQPGSVGVALGPEVAIMDEAGNLLPSGKVGEVVIRGANVTQGYENNSQANESAFTKGWFRTGDLGYLDKDKYLFLKGRSKEIINRGGEKISPREVEEVILEHPAIEQVVAFAIPHTLLGEDVAVAVVMNKEASVTEQELKEFTAARLANFKIPNMVLFVDEIPQGPTGKQQRIGLAEKLGLTASAPTAAKPEFTPPHRTVEENLSQIWSKVLEVERIGIHDNFFQLGGDSILAAQVVNRVRETLQVELSFPIFFEQPTVASMAMKITQSQAAKVMSKEIDNILANLEFISDEEAQQLLDKMK